MAQTKPKAGQFYGVSGNGTDGQFLQTDGAGGMTWATPVTNPTLTSIDYPGSTTAADPAGGESIIINGTGFQTGITCTIGGTSATTAFNSATQITITSPAKAAGQYTVAVTNTDSGSVSQANFIQYSGVPVWSTASGSLGSVEEGASASFQVTATEGSDTIEYAVTSGSLPSGLSLNTNTGAITGTAGAVSADTTSTFSITATDDENQTSSARSFNITVTNLVPSGFINAKIYTGNGSNAGSYPSIGGSLDVTTDFTPDLVIVKARDAATGWVVGDSVRGNYGYMYLNTQSADGSACGGYGSNPCSGSNANGGIGMGTNKFIVKDDASGNYGVSGPGTLYQAFAWKAGGAPSATNSAGAGNVPTLGSVMIDGVASTSAVGGNVQANKMTVNTDLDFSIVQFTSVAGTTNQVPHGLSGTPDVFIFKRADSSESWWTYTQAIDGSLDYLVFNTNDAKSDSAETAPTSTAVYQPTGSGGREYMLYAFKNVDGFSKIGKYDGNGSTYGPFVETGFEPAIIFIKRTDSAANWRSVNNATSTSNPRSIENYPNLTNVEQANFPWIDFYSNGFQIITNDTNSNASGGVYFYMAFAADPSSTTPSLASSFSANTYTGNDGTNPITTGFAPDFTWIKSTTDTRTHSLVDTIRFPYILQSESTAVQWDGASYIQSLDSNGFTVQSNSNFINNSSQNYVSWNWKGGGIGTINTDGTQTSVVSVNQAAGFSIVYSSSASSGNYTWGHGLSKAPEFWTYKAVDYAYGWETLYPKTFGVDAGSLTASDWELLILNTDAAKVNNIHYAADNSVLASVGGGWGQFNTFIAYCWHSVAGYSKIGTYTASGSAGSPTITTGFEPGFVLIKNVDRAQEWIIIDSARGLNKSLQPNSTSPESVNGNIITTNATSFTIDVNGGGINYASGDTMLYMAFKQN